MRVAKLPEFAAPHYPIIYVRGYAMTTDEINAATADPFCGFNLGSTTFRAVPDKTKPARKYLFESPMVRLASEFGYEDVFEDGYDIVDPEWERSADGKLSDNKLRGKSVVIYRYYDSASTLLGQGKTPSMEDFAIGLSKLIARVSELVCRNPANAIAHPDDFRCYLVAHSMGGLVCRAMLQNPALDPHGMRSKVDKFFTFATPHNGIDVGGLNVPSWLKLFDVDNFNRESRMSDYLDLKSAYADHHRVDLLPENRFPARKVFCMVGTNRMDYEAAAGLSRTFVGNGSDGLVRIANATLQGLKSDGSLGEPCAKAFAFRSHSGYFGIVNSEESYQNLTRFLFGDIRIDAWLDVENIRLPTAVKKIAGDSPAVNALYQIEVTASPRGKLWYLTRRMAEEDSVACLEHASWQKNRSLYLSSVFLADRGKVDPSRPSLACGLRLGIRAPDYEIERRLWMNEHYEGGYLFHDGIILEIFPGGGDVKAWTFKYAWQGTGVAEPLNVLAVKPLDGGRVQVDIPFDSHTLNAEGAPEPSYPGVKANLRLVIEAWNSYRPQGKN